MVGLRPEKSDREIGILAEVSIRIRGVCIFPMEVLEMSLISW